MNSAAARNLGPNFSALLALADVRELPAADLTAAIRGLYPNAKVAGWGGRGAVAQGDRGIMLSVDGVDIGIVHQRRRAPPGTFDGGNQPHFYWQDSESDLQRYKAHLFVIEAAVGEVEHSIARARTVTMVADAISSIRPILGMTWENAKNPVRADHFVKLMGGFRTDNMIPVGLWVRLLSSHQPGATTGVAGTFGLQPFGSPNIEIHTHRLGYADSLTIALSYAESWLKTRKPTWNEATTTVEDVASFRIEQMANGIFDVGSVAKLTEIVPGVEPSPGIQPAKPFVTREHNVHPDNVIYNVLLGQTIRGIRNAFYKKPPEAWDAARIETTRQLDGFLAYNEANQPRPQA